MFFTNSGAEALECAIKTARRYHFSKGHPEKFHIITFEGAFHGRTLATIAAGGQAEVSRRLRPEGAGLLSGAVRRHELRLKAAITEETAAILIEPIQGEGGIRPCHEGVPAGAAPALRRDTACC